VIHRDLKPGNVFLTRSGSATVPKLIDFGIAKVADGDANAVDITRTGATVGTPAYMSPEQARGELDVGAQSDVWAMGVVMFETLAGRTPWTGENYNQLLYEIASGKAARLSDLAPEVPLPLVDVVHRAIDPDRARRFADMQALLDAVLDCEGLEPGDWRDKLRAAHQAAMQLESSTSSEPPREAENATTAPTMPAIEAAAGAKTPIVALDPVASASPPRASLPAREPSLRLPVDRSFTTGAAIVGVVAVLAGATVFLAMRSHTPGAPGPHATNAAPLPAPPVETFAAVVTVHPASATLEIDGASTGVNSLARSFARDGRRHVLRATAPGYEPFAMEFTDVPPPSSIDLRPATTAVTAPATPTPAAPVVAAQVTTPTAPAASRHAPPRSTPPPARTPRSTPMGANGTPLLGGEE
jgi:serine/threonine-protein kinase